MIALLSSAKTLDYERPLPQVDATVPRFAAEASILAAAAANLSQKRLAELMDISKKLAKLNADRFAGFDAQPERPAHRESKGRTLVRSMSVQRRNANRPAIRPFERRSLEERWPAN